MDAHEVNVAESTERWTEVKLEDGSVLRIKPSVVAAIRIEGSWDADGNPVYALKATNTMVVCDAPQHLKKARKIEAVKRSVYGYCKLGRFDI